MLHVRMYSASFCKASVYVYTQPVWISKVIIFFFTKNPLGQFDFILWRNTFIPAWRHYFGCTYSETWMGTCSHLFLWNLDCHA